MVFFSCDGCGEMLKKNAVDTHASRCRRCDAVSCVDCSVSFYGDDYRAHTSCITEAEAYEGNLYKPGKKKRNPQEEWMDIVTSCVTTAPGPLRVYLSSMSTLDNIPRKEKQFRNFTSNSLNLRGRNEEIVGQIWNVLSEEREKRRAVKEIIMEQERKQKEEEKKLREASEPKKKAESSDDDDSSSDESEPKKKVESSDNSSSDEEEKKPAKPQTSESKSTAAIIDPKKVKKAMKKALKKAPNRSMKIKDLRNVLGDKLGLSKSARKGLKELLLEAPNTSKKAKIKVDGKIITLIV